MTRGDAASWTLRMHRFRTVLECGSKRPYQAWTFLVIPDVVAKAWGTGPKTVRGTVAGYAFMGTAARGEGVLRVPLNRDFRERAGIACGDTVDVALQVDPSPPPVCVPPELQEMLDNDPEVAELYEKLPPSLRRAWAGYVASAKRPETRCRRALQAPGGIRARTFPR